MFSPDELDARRGVSVSRPARALTSALERTDRLFDRVFSSSFNPLYRTGTVAVLLLGIALVTGVYLLFAYEIGRPYESVLGIQRDVLVGRWVRALHRYASDAAVVAVAVHVLRLVVQRKTWGPRALAWITGVLLTGMMGMTMDPSLQGRRTGAKAGFDCTKPFGREGEVPLMRSAAKTFRAPARFQTVEQALGSGPMFYADIVEGVGSDDGREVACALDGLRQEGKLGRDRDGRYHLASGKPGQTAIVGALYHDPNEGT